jgi:hypothetical protein
MVKKLIFFFVTENIAFDVVDRIGFQEVAKEFVGKDYKPPSSSTVTKNIMFNNLSQSCILAAISNLFS